MEDCKKGLLSESIVYCTALYLAAQNGHRDVVKFISELPIKPIGSHLFKYTAFYFAAQNGHMSVLEHFARNGINFIDDVIDETTHNLEHTAENLTAGQSSYTALIQNNLNTYTDVNNEAGQIIKPSCSKASYRHNEACENIENKYVIKNATGVVREEKFENIFDAVKKGSVKQVNEFFAGCIDVNAHDEDKNTLLHFAAARGDVDIVKILLNKNAKLKPKNKIGNTPIHIASAFGNLGVVEEFLERGVNHRILNPVGNTPIHLAAKYNRSDIFKLLLHKGASIKKSNHNGDTCLHFAVEIGCKPVDELYLEPKDRTISIIDIKQENTDVKATFPTPDQTNLRTIIETLKANINVNSKNRKGETALFCTSDVTVLKLLGKSGLNFQLTNKDGETVLHHAARCNNSHVVDYLLKQRIFDVDVTNYLYETPLHIAASYGHYDVIKVLINYNANLDEVSQRQYNFCGHMSDIYDALQIAVFKGHYNVVEILLENGAVIGQSKAFEGGVTYESSPLMQAALNGDIKIAELLLIYGDKKELPEIDPDTGKPYSYNMEVMKLIEDY